MNQKKMMIQQFNRREKMKKTLKGAIKSWTIRANALFAIIVSSLPIAQDQLPAIKPYLGQQVFYYLSAVVVISNILLRFKTNKGLDEK